MVQAAIEAERAKLMKEAEVQRASETEAAVEAERLRMQKEISVDREQRRMQTEKEKRDSAFFMEESKEIIVQKIQSTTGATED